MPKNQPKKKGEKKKKQAKHSFIDRCKAWCTKRRLIKLGIIVLAAIIIISLAGYFININIKLLFDTETHITLSPSIMSITVPDKTSPEVSFTTTVEKLRICDITCKHLLVDATNERTISEGELSAEKETVTNYELPLTGQGEGQSVFIYTVTCMTTEKKLCPSKGKHYQKTAYLTVNYGLSEEESAIKETLAAQLPEQASSLAASHLLMDETIAIIDALNSHADASEQVLAAAILEKELAAADERESIIIEAWTNEQFLVAQALSEEQMSKGNSTAQRIEELARTTKAIREEYESAMNITQSIHDRSDMISGWSGFLKRMDSQAYDLLRRADERYQALTTTHEKTALQLAEAEDILAATKVAEAAYVIARAEEKTSQGTIRSAYEQAVIANNSTWGRDDCPYYDYLLTFLNGTNTSLQSLNDHLEDYCPVFLDEKFFADEPLPILTIEDTAPVSPRMIPTPVPQCCYQEQCKPCAAPPPTPIILVHGHSFSKSTSPELAFARMNFIQSFLAQDGFIHASTINNMADLASVPAGDWGKQPAPIVIGVTYYYLNYYDLGQLSFTTRKTESIESYAIRLREAIETVQEKTGSDQVIIIAHSMGGLVAREYLYLFGDSKVEQLITIGTPNYGIEGDVKTYCTLTGAKQECDEMAADSIFLKRLNEPRNNPQHTDIYTIRAIGCPTKSDEGVSRPGDGIILASSVILDFAEENYVINGTCTDLLKTNLHMDFINPELYPETYDIIKKILVER